MINSVMILPGTLTNLFFRSTRICCLRMTIHTKRPPSRAIANQMERKYGCMVQLLSRPARETPSRTIGVMNNLYRCIIDGLSALTPLAMSTARSAQTHNGVPVMIDISLTLLSVMMIEWVGCSQCFVAIWGQSSTYYQKIFCEAVISGNPTELGGRSPNNSKPSP